MIKNYFSTPYEQWQNGLAEASVNSVTMLAIGRTMMAESRLSGQFWFSSTMHGVNCRNATFKERPAREVVWEKEGRISVQTIRMPGVHAPQQ